MRLAASVLLVLPLLPLLLAGCSDSRGTRNPADVADDGLDLGAAGNATAESKAAAPRGDRLSFAAEPRESSQAFEGSYGPTESCFPLPGLPCDGTQRHDLTALVTVGAPTQVTLEMQNDGSPGSIVSQSLEVEGGWFTYTDFGENEQLGTERLVAVVLLEPGGTLGLAVRYALPGLFPPQDLHYTVQVGAVVRPDVLPQFLPVALDLAVGESIEVRGSGLEALVVIPPTGSALHHTAVPFTFNATAATGGGGRHILVVTGGVDLALYGPAGRALTPKPVLRHLGEPHPLASGQPVSWEFTAPGVPLQIGLLVGYSETAAGWAVAPSEGNYEAKVTRQGATILEATQAGCVPACQTGFVAPANAGSVIYALYLDERMGIGSYQADARFEVANSLHLREVVFYVEP